MPAETVDHYKELFLSRSQQHIYIRDVIKPADYRAIKNPYMAPALACLGLCMSNGSPMRPESSDVPAGTAEELFHTARILWSVICECDNRETRKRDCILAVRMPILAKDRHSH